MLLTISIPSHNKTYFLKQAIESIIKEPKFGNEVDLVISDNSLTDETKELYNYKYKNNENINWFKSKSYSCLDSNVNRAVELSSGEYVWIFGDDDIIEPGILLSLTNYLKKYKPEILLLNSKSFIGSQIIEESRVPILFRKIYTSSQNDLFLKEMGSYLTYIGSIIVRRDLWLNSYDRSKIGTYFAHINCIANMKIGRSSHYFPTPAINMRLGSQTWTSKSFLIWHKFFPEIIWGLENYSNDAKNQVIMKQPMKSLTVLAASRAYKRFNYSIWREIILNSNNNFLIKFLSFFLSITPSKILAMIYRLYIRKYRKNHTFKFSPKLALAKLKL